jgi:hypothetical protein
MRSAKLTEKSSLARLFLRKQFPFDCEVVMSAQGGGVLQLTAARQGDYPVALRTAPAGA